MNKKRVVVVPFILILAVALGPAFDLIAQEKEKPKNVEEKKPLVAFTAEHLLIKPSETISIGEKTNLKTEIGFAVSYSYKMPSATMDEVGLEITPRLIDEKGIELKIRVLRNGKTVKEELIVARNLEPVVIELLQNEADHLKLADKITPLILPVYPSSKDLRALDKPGFSTLLTVPSEFRGRMLTGVGTGLPSVMNVKILLDSYTTQNEAAQFQDFLDKNDSKGFFNAFGLVKKGSLQFLGETGLNIGFHAAFETPTDKGMKIILVGESRSLPAGFSPSADAWKATVPGKVRSGLFLFLVAELDLDKNFKGEGKVYEEAKITFTPGGGIKLDSYVKTPKTIVNIEKTK